MSTSLTVRAREIRALIQSKLDEECEKKLDPVRKKYDGVESSEGFQEESEKIREAYEADVWLGDALAKSEQIQIVSHLAKAVYPDAKIKEVSSAYVQPSAFKRSDHISSAWVHDSLALDVTGNAAALPIMRVLDLVWESETFFQMALRGDADLKAALHDDPDIAEEWLKAIQAIKEPKTPRVSSHAMMKQLFWPVEPESDEFVILSPLYSSGFSQHIYNEIRETFTGKDAQARAKDRRAGKASDEPVYSYPDLARSALGGSNPQNLSRGNSQRVGINYHLSSKPPVWRGIATPSYRYADDVFKAFARRPIVKNESAELLRFLKASPDAVIETREHVREIVELLSMELLAFSAEHHELAPGWSEAQHLRLAPWQKLWLDPYRALEVSDVRTQFAQGDWLESVAGAFARWLNKILYELGVGDVEFEAWSRAVSKSQEWVTFLNGVVDDLSVSSTDDDGE